MNLGNASIVQVMIPVADFEHGVAFYRDVLGLPFLFAAPPQMAFFQVGSIRVLVGVLQPGQEAQRGGSIYFQVPDIQSVFAALGQAGVQFSAEPHVVHRTATMEHWLAEFSDPDGNHLALMSEVARDSA